MAGIATVIAVIATVIAGIATVIAVIATVIAGLSLLSVAMRAADALQICVPKRTAGTAPIGVLVTFCGVLRQARSRVVASVLTSAALPIHLRPALSQFGHCSNAHARAHARFDKTARAAKGLI